MFEWELVKCVNRHFVPDISEADLKKSRTLEKGTAN